MRLGDLDEALRMIKDSKTDNPFVGNVTTRVWEMAHDSAISCVEATPTIDAVTVVRCKDCKHRGNHEVCQLMDIRLCFDGDGHMDEVEDDKTEDEFFCPYGESKDGESIDEGRAGRQETV